MFVVNFETFNFLSSQNSSLTWWIYGSLAVLLEAALSTIKIVRSNTWAHLKLYKVDYNGYNTKLSFAASTAFERILQRYQQNLFLVLWIINQQEKKWLEY